MYVSSYYNKKRKDMGQIIQPFEKIYVKINLSRKFHHNIYINKKRCGTNHTTTRKNICFLLTYGTNI
jgi:alpha-tubulin suppressor-like RCC1 family protein